MGLQGWGNPAAAAFSWLHRCTLKIHVRPSVLEQNL